MSYQKRQQATNHLVRLGATQALTRLGATQARSKCHQRLTPHKVELSNNPEFLKGPRQSCIQHLATYFFEKLQHSILKNGQHIIDSRSGSRASTERFRQNQVKINQKP